ncbi:hypothetical protein GCM10009798_33590 [Nocardioides panacihumi]|uniref:Uncharacterized protein n=1 Tax=Nocardioides panacihumi TaxID=400774 RepID=A0ABN2RKF9_9ACTN
MSEASHHRSSRSAPDRTRDLRPRLIESLGAAWSVEFGDNILDFGAPAFYR